MTSIAVAGKGGVGKTLIASGIAWTLVRAGYKTIAIDADPSPNLALALGLSQSEADRIVPVAENEKLIKIKTGTGFPGVYNLNFPVADVVRDFAIPTPAGAHLIVMGTVRSMGSGCTCPANSLLRTLLRHLVLDRDEAVVLDMEAGIEHIGRGTAEGVDLMIVVSDANRRSLSVASGIARMSKEAGIAQVMLVGNRVADAREEEMITGFGSDEKIPLLGLVPFDPAVSTAGISGDPVTALEGSPAILSIEKTTGQILQLTGEQKNRFREEADK